MATTTQDTKRGGSGLLARERGVLEAILPGLDAALEQVPLAELEQRGGPALGAFKAAGGPALLIPEQHGGIGATPVQAVRVQRALASRSPSLAIATNMHHLSMASVVEHLERTVAPDAFEWALINGIAAQSLLVSSALAEGRSGVSNMKPMVRAVRAGENYLVSGAKKPCSLSGSMDLFSGTVLIEGDDEHAGKIAFAVVPADADGIERKIFWESPILAAAESDELIFDEVVVHENLVVAMDMRPGDPMDPTLVRGWTWFEVLAISVYIGVASALVERVLAAGKGGSGEVGALGAELEASMAAVEAVAADVVSEIEPSEVLARSLFVRYSVQEAVVRVANRAADILGGINFIRDPDVGYLVAAARVMAFHPPSRTKCLPALAACLAGEPFDASVF
ncbi:MAG TPA: acyl-CoA dehydrogenase family protein [Solirubrobacteraceae bacterium]|jgi:alkylation response protein AidB-like acyl-CoA dehydrogenase